MAMFKVKTIQLVAGLAAATMLLNACSTKEETSAPSAMNQQSRLASSTGEPASNEARSSAELITANSASGASGKLKAGGHAYADAEPIASIPERDIHLYPGAQDGVILQIGEMRQQMNWIYATPRNVMPVLQAGDYDSDGQDELAVVLHIGSGSGVSIDELHVVRLMEDDNASGANPFIDHVFQSEDYLAQLKEALQFQKIAKNGDLFGQITIGDETHEVDLTAFQKDFGKAHIGDELGFGNIVNFRIEKNKLIFTAGIGLVIDGVAEAQYFGEAEAAVSYSSGSFKLDEWRFTIES